MQVMVLGGRDRDATMIRLRGVMKTQEPRKARDRCANGPIMRRGGASLRVFSASSVAWCGIALLANVCAASPSGAVTVSTLQQWECSDGQRSRWTVSSKAALVLDGGQEPFVTVAGAVVIGDTVVVADAGSQRLHIYLRTGELLRVVGGRGLGPGEFVSLSWIQKFGRGFIAYDRDPRRLSEFDARGELVRTATIRPGEGFLFPRAIGVFGDGSALIAAAGREQGLDRAEGVYRRTWALLRHDARGGFVDSLTAFQGTESYSEPWRRGGQISGPLFFGKQSSVAVGPTSFYVVENDDDRIAVFDLKGNWTKELRLSEAPAVRAVTSEDIAAVREQGAGIEAPPEVLAVFDRMPFPDAFAPYGWHGTRRLEMLRVDPAGRVWVVHAGGQRDTRPVWTVFGADGEVEACVMAQELLDVLASTGEFVIVRHWDEFDVETVQFRRLNKIVW